MFRMKSSFYSEKPVHLFLVGTSLDVTLDTHVLRCSPMSLKPQ